MKLVTVALVMMGLGVARADVPPTELVPLPLPSELPNDRAALRDELDLACRLPAQWASCKTSLEALRGQLAVAADADQAAFLADMERKVAAWSVVVPKTLGVLLPLTGPQAKAGEAAREAIALALAGTGVNAVFEDSGGAAQLAEAAALKLIERDHVSALLGPIGRQETAAVAAIARRFYVPMVTLAVVADEGSVAATDVVMRVRTSPIEVAQFLAQEARARMGIMRAAVLYPDTDLGKEAATAFAEGLQAAGGDVARLVAYDPKTTDFKPVMKALMQAEKPGKKVVADFDAVFIPDAPEVVKRIMPLFEMWRVSLRTSPLPTGASGVPVVAKGGKVTPVQLLGGAAWDSPLIIDRTEGLTENAAFAVIRADSASPEGAAFISAFTAKYGKAPLSFHAEVYDATRFIGGPLATLDGANQDLRLALQALLKRSRSDAGATGPLRVTYGALAPRVQLMTVHGAAIRARLSEDDERTQRAGAMSTPP